MPGSFVLPLVLALPVLGAIFVMCTPKAESSLHRGLGIAFSTITFLVLGILNYAIPFALFPYAEMTVASSIVGVINGMTPMTTVIVSQLWPGGEKATWNKSIGVIVGLLGAIILASPSFGEGGQSQVVGLLCALAATLCYALTLNYARRFKNVDSTVTASASLTGAAMRRRAPIWASATHMAIASMAVPT